MLVDDAKQKTASILSAPPPRPVSLPADEGGAMKRKRSAQSESQETPVETRERLLREITQYVTDMIIPAEVSMATVLSLFDNHRFS